jgi:hypothetical protein
MSVHADDLLLTASPERLRQALEAEMSIKWGDEVGADRWIIYLGKEWRRTPKGFMTRVPRKYFEKMLEKQGMLGCRPAVTPFVQGDAAHDPETKVSEHEAHVFRSVVGQLMWVLPERPDLAYPVKELARKVSGPTTADWARLKRVLKYVAGTLNVVLTYEYDGEASELELDVLSDASWASSGDMRSTSAATIWLQGWLIGFYSRTQSVVAQSSCEAELLAMNAAAAEGLMVASLLQEQGRDVCLRLFTDSTAATATTDRLGFGKRLRHLRVKVLWLQEAVRERRLSVMRVPTDDNIADLLTKPMNRPRFHVLCEAIGFRDFAEDV